MVHKLIGVMTNSVGSVGTKIASGSASAYFSGAEVVGWWNAATGTDCQRRLAVRSQIAARIESQLGPHFLPTPGGPLIHEVDFDESTGQVKVVGNVGGSLEVA